MNPIWAAAITASVIVVVNGVAALIGVGKIIERLDNVEEAGAAREEANQERHEENRKRLKGLKKEFQRLNGSVARHEAWIVSKGRKR